MVHTISLQTMSNNYSGAVEQQFRSSSREGAAVSADLDERDRLRHEVRKGSLAVSASTIRSWRFFTRVEKEPLINAIGETLALERFSVIAAAVFACLSPLVSFWFAVKAFAWWSLLVVPAAIVFFVFWHGRSCRSRAMRSFYLFSGVAVNWYMARTTPDWMTFLLIYTFGLYCSRLTYTLAVEFMCALVIRNEQAWDFFFNEAFILEEPDRKR